MAFFKAYGLGAGGGLFLYGFRYNPRKYCKSAVSGVDFGYPVDACLGVGVEFGGAKILISPFIMKREREKSFSSTFPILPLRYVTLFLKKGNHYIISFPNLEISILQFFPCKAGTATQ